MSKIRDKLTDLARFAGRNPSQVWNEELETLEKSVSKMERYEDFLNHPVSREIIPKLCKWVEECDMLLLSEESVKESERMKMVSRRQTIIDILGIFSPRNTKGQNLETYLDSTIAEFRNYYK